MTTPATTTTARPDAQAVKAAAGKRVADQLQARQDRLAEYTQCLRLLHPDPADVFEVRFLNVPNNRWKPIQASGYFDGHHLDAAAIAIETYSEDRKAAGCYVTLNARNPALLARAHNRVVDNPAATTTDAEIIRRQWLFVDIDPIRPSGIAANDAEVKAAEDLLEVVVERLRGFSFSYPLIANSGNGRYALYKIDLKNNDESTAMLRRFYAGLRAILPTPDPGGPSADIDTGVYNAARIARIGGTWNRKGDSTPDRPHRRCQYFDPGDSLD
jgi:hypothetical protein